MEPVEYVFHIDVFTPDTLPMSRLAEYLGELAKLIWHQDHTHFVRVEKGSARLVHKVDVVDAPKVAERLNAVRLGQAPKDALKAQAVLENLLANDNAIGTLIEVQNNRVALPFVGRNRPKPIVIPAFRDQAVLDGKVVSVGGRDATAHAILQDGEVFHTNIRMRRDMARDLAPLLYGPSVRLFGDGRFERSPEGVWKISDFRVERFEVLKDASLDSVLAKVRDLIGPERADTLRAKLDEDRDAEDDGE